MYELFAACSIAGNPVTIEMKTVKFGLDEMREYLTLSGIKFKNTESMRLSYAVIKFVQTYGLINILCYALRYTPPLHTEN